MPNLYQRSATKKAVFPKTPKFRLALISAELTQKEAAHDMLMLTYKGSMKRVGTRTVKHGDPVKFTWSYGRTSGVFIGFVHTIEKKNLPSSINTVIVCINNSSVMKRSNKKIFKERTASQIVSFIADKYRFKKTIAVSIKKYKRLAQSGKSDWQILRQMAKDTGFALRVENSRVTFKSRDKIISEKLTSGSAPTFLHINNAPRGMAAQQTLISFTALDGQVTPEHAVGDAGIVMFDRDGTKYEFNPGYNVTNGQEPSVIIESPYDWQPAIVETTQDMVDQTMLVPTADPEEPAGAYIVTSYGASTTSSNNLSAFQAALNAAGAAASAGNIKYVYVPEGTWTIVTSGATRLNMKSYVYLKVNSKATIKNVGTSHMLVTDPTYSQTAYGGLTNATVDGGIWDANLTAKGITFTHSSGVTIKNLTIKDIAGDCHGIEINSSTSALIDNCRLVGIYKMTSGTRTGLAPRDWDEAIQVDYAWDGAAPYSGSDGTPCSGVTIQNCYIGPSGTPGSTYYPRAIGGHQANTNTNRHSNINILNNTIVGCNGTGGGAIRIYNMQSVLVQGNNISNTYRAINGYITTDNSNTISGLTGIQIKDNIINNCGSWKSHGATNAYAAIELNVKDGISGSPTFNTVVITGNQITNHHGDTNYGIKATECNNITVQNNYVPDRHCGSSTSNMISVSGTGTVTVSKNTPDNT